MEGLRQAEHQAAGHAGAMVDASGMIFVKPSTPQEIQWYTAVQEMPYDETQECDLGLFVPAFLGTLQQGITDQVEQTQTVTEELKELDKGGGDGKPYAVLENLLYGYTKPAIMDVKLGSVLHDENTPKEKRDRLQKVSSSTTSASLHYRVCGMKTYGSLPDLSAFENTEAHVTSDGEYVMFDKWFGRSLTPDNVLECFRVFFTHNGLSKLQQRTVIDNMIARLEMLSRCLKTTEFRSRSGSVLFTFENDLDRWDDLKEDPIFTEHLDYDEDEDELPVALSQLNLIDFAHARFVPGEGPDEDIIEGVNNLVKVLRQLA